MGINEDGSFRKIDYMINVFSFKFLAGKSMIDKSFVIQAFRLRFPQIEYKKDSNRWKKIETLIKKIQSRELCSKIMNKN